MIREAVEEAFGPTASLPNPERTSSSIEDCGFLAVAIASYAEETQRRIAELEKECEALKERIALTSRISVEEIIDEVPLIPQRLAAPRLRCYRRLNAANADTHTKQGLGPQAGADLRSQRVLDW